MVNTLKLSKKELKKLLHIWEVEYQELFNRLSECLCISGAGPHFTVGKAHLCKKHKHLQKVLNANNRLSTSEDTVPYPTGEVPGQGGCQLIDFLNGNKVKYNSFLVHFPPYFPTLDPLTQHLADMCSGGHDCCWYPKNLSLEIYTLCCSWRCP